MLTTAGLLRGDARHIYFGGGQLACRRRQHRGGSRHCVLARQGHRLPHGALTLRVKLTRTVCVMCAFANLMGVGADLMGVGADLMGVSADLIGFSADLMGVSADLMGVSADLMGVSADHMGVSADLMG
eukprot:1235101-Pyramimonas_sp.AAC.2